MPTPLICQLCPRHCQLNEGQRGDCRVRIHLDGKLFTLNYGKPCAVHVDPIEKKPLFHVRPGSASFSLATAGCNLHCKFCQNWQISQRPPEETENYDLSPQDVVNAAVQNNCQSIAYTYSDPVIFYEYMLDTAKIAKPRKILNLMVTAGYIEKEPLLELCPWIDAANIDLKGITDKFYKDVCLATLAPVQECIKLMKKQNVWVEITNLIVPTLNDKEDEIRLLCRWIVDNVGVDTPLHFSRFWPMHQLKNLPPTPTEILTRAREIAIREGIHYCYIGNVPSDNGSNTYCPVDKEILIRRYGYQVLENNIIDGRCKFCSTKIPGIW